MKKSIIAAAVLTAVAGSASAFSVSFTQDSGFLFDPVYSNTATPQARDIGIHQTLSGGRVQSLWWGNDNPNRGTVGPSTPIVETLNPGGYPVNFDPAPWTTNISGPNSNGQADSALKVIGLGGTLTAGGGWVPISQTFHSNQTISQDDMGLLTSGVIRSILSFDGVPTPANDVAFDFYETPNADSAYYCPDNSGASCDIFQFAPTGFDPIYLTDNGKTYEISFDLLPGVGSFLLTGTNWGNNACQAGNFCVGTKEGVVSYLTVLMSMNEVPEPDSLALIGLGLLGAGASLRRRKNRS